MAAAGGGRRCALEVLAAVLRDTVDLGELPDATPKHVTDLLGRCLDRDLDDIASEVFDIPAIAGTPAVCCHNSVYWALFAAHSA